MTPDQSEKPVIAVFDFDNTITSRSTPIDMAIFLFGWRKIFATVFRFLPAAISYLLGYISIDELKEELFNFLYGRLSQEEFDKFCGDYVESRLPKILNKKATEKIREHKNTGHRVVIVSASLENWIRPWALTNGVDEIIATKPEIKEGVLTGRFNGKNCNREEKARRFLERYPNRKDYTLYVYGDSMDDKYLFKIADKYFFKRFN